MNKEILQKISGSDFLNELLSRMRQNKIRYAIRRNNKDNIWEMLIEETETGDYITVDLTGLKSEVGSEIRWFNIFKIE